ncbi:B-box zinc finger protein 21 [Spatholobus suberectus]|nr:B-box zinc finger protein 21 [Spatholobus suberectus]
MKIQCDVCNKHQASLFCTADEAALCDGCDHRVHHANKLASKHQRFSLVPPSAKHFPLCDVCQERRAFVFCQQDRAVLCKECDVPIHSANDLTKKHNRFLLTGIKFSAYCHALYITTQEKPCSRFFRGFASTFEFSFNSVGAYSCQ